MRVTTTSRTRAALRADPVMAMAIEGLTHDREGTLHLYAISDHGPFRVIYIDPENVDHRAESKVLSTAVARAIGGAA